MKYFVTLFTFFILPLYYNVVLGQGDKPSPVQFHGSNKLFGEYSNMQGVGSEIPPSFVRDDLQMTLTLYGIPISSSFFLTSEQQNFRQSIDNFRFYLDVAALKRTALEKATVVVKSMIPAKLLKIKDDLTKSTDLLNTSLLKNTSLRDQAQVEYDKAKKQFADSASLTNQDLLQKAKLKLDTAIAKVEEIKAKLQLIKTRLEQADAAIEKAKSLAESPNLLKSGEEKAKGMAMSKFGRFLSIFTTLEIGKCRPNYSELTLKGIAVSGVNIEMNPGLFYAAFSMGKVKRAVEPQENSTPAYKQDLLFIKIGVGKKTRSHFYLTYMRVLDNENSLPSNLKNDSLNLYPKANHILGTEGELSLFKNKFTMEGEAAVSLFTRDSRSPGLEWKDSQVPSWLTSYIKPNASTSVDFSYMAKMGLKLRTTTISGGIKMIGAGYNTLGNPNLINDRMTYDGRIDQTFAKNQVTFSVFYRQSNDNLVHWKAGTTTTVSYGITAGLRLRKAPYFMVSYMPNFQKTNNDSLKLNNSIYMVTASTGYFYKIGKVNMNTGFNYSRQYSRIIRDTATDLSTTNSYALNQDMNFKIPLSFTIGANYSQSFLSKENQDILSLTLSGNYRAFKDKWENSLGVRYSDQSHKQTKLGYFLNSIVRISKIADIGIQIEKNTFRNDPQCTKNYDEFIAKFTFGIRW